MNQEDIEARKKRLWFLQESARQKTREAGEAARRADEYERKIRELEQEAKEAQPTHS